MTCLQKGFAPVIVVLIALGTVAVIGGGTILYKNSQSTKSTESITHEDLEKLKELTGEVQNTSPSTQTPLTDEDRSQYEQKKNEVQSKLEDLQGQNPPELTWEDLGSLLRASELLQRMGDPNGLADQMLDILRKKAEEMIKAEMAKDICNITLDQIQQILQHAAQAMLLGAQVDGLMEWLGDAVQTLAAERVDTWPEKWPPEFNITTRDDWDESPEDMLDKITPIDCSTSGGACERLDFLELAAMAGKEDLMQDIIVGNFEKIKTKQRESCKKGCCIAGGVLTENVLKNVCERTPGALWKEGKCQTGYRVHLSGKSTGGSDLGAMFGPGMGKFEKLLGADMNIEMTGYADLTTCAKTVNSEWKGIMVTRITTSNKQLGTETKLKEEELVLNFNEDGVFEGYFDVFLANLGFSAKITGDNMTFTYKYGGTMPDFTMQGKIEKGKVVCDVVAK